ncbi:MAG: hypothetical protein M3O30_09680 [Planctomycetota bacterium]|nr:hypothetical protein [Planctomycetota bacterium]
MHEHDIFNFFRQVLGVIVTIYASVVTLQSLYGWYIYLSSGDRYVSLARRYILVQGLRLRFRTFWGDVLICLLLAIIFCMLWHARNLVVQLDLSVHSHGGYSTTH